MNSRKNLFDVIGQLSALRRYARSLTRDDAAAEDLVQDSLLRAYERRGSFRDGGNMQTWLLAILHNAFIDGMRSRKSEAKRLDQIGEELTHRIDPPQEHAVRLSQVRQAFMQLPEDQRVALHLVAIEGLSYQEAASMLSIPVGTLMSRIGRARSALRALEAEPANAALRLVGGRDVANS